MTFTVLVAGGRNFGDLASLNGDRSSPLWAEREYQYKFILVKINEAGLKHNWPRTPEDELGNWLYDVKIVSGGARGVDAVAIDWAVVNWCQFKEYPPRWEDFTERPCRIVKRKLGSGYYNALAGFNRNQRMIDSERIDFALLFPGGKGTADMKRRIIEAKIPFEEFNGDAPILQVNKARQERPSGE